MSLLIIEGARKSGKTYLVQQQKSLPVFKFDFNSNFETWEFSKNDEIVHWFGLGKEVMLHELDNQGFLPKIIVDRGILTNSVWGVFQGRITEQEAKRDLINFSKRGFFRKTKIILVEGLYEQNRNKDIWDKDDQRREEEKGLFSSFSSLLLDLGVDIEVFHNNMDLDSVIRFKSKVSQF
jgi:hypothetical protein